MRKDEYKLTRTCQSCQHIEELYIEKRAAAFDLIKIGDSIGHTCSNCKKTAFSYSREMPEIDEELLIEWASNNNLFLLEQDEDLILADVHYLDFIFNVIDMPQTLDNKRATLFSALCTIVYDEVDENISGTNSPTVKEILQFLSQRKEILLSLIHI